MSPNPIRRAICLALAYAPVFLTSSAWNTLSNAGRGRRGNLEGKKKQTEKPHHTHRSSPLRNFIMTKGRMEMPFFLIKSLIDETQLPGKPRV